MLDQSHNLAKTNQPKNTHHLSFRNADAPWLLSSNSRFNMNFSTLLLLLMMIVLPSFESDPMQLQTLSQSQIDELNEEEHLCGRVVNRQLDRLHLKSITYSPNQELIFFEGNRFYRLGDGGGSSDLQLPLDHLPFPEQFERWNEVELASVSEKIHFWFQSSSRVTSSPTSAYILTQGSVSSWLGLVGGLKVVALLLSETSEALFSIAPTATAYKATMIFNRRRPAAEFAIVFRQNSDGKEVSFDGFVLHKDTWQNSSQYVLYDLQQEDRSEMVKVYLGQSGRRLEKENPKSSRKKGEENPAPPNYYLIQRSTTADEVLLVQGGGNEEKDPTAEKYSPTRSLFGGMDKYLPVGYRYRNYTFLFDQLLGCVYRLEHEHDLKLDSKSMSLIRLKRTSIPYERFFRCSSERFPAPEWSEEERLQVERRWPADRCEQNYLKENGNGNGGGGGGGGGEPTIPGGGGGGGIAGDWKTVVAIFGGALLLLIFLVAVCIVCFGVYLCRCCGSSAAVGGDGKQQQLIAGGRKRMHPLVERAATSVISYMPFLASSSYSVTSSATPSTTPSKVSPNSSETNIKKGKKTPNRKTPNRKSPKTKKLEEVEEEGGKKKKRKTPAAKRGGNAKLAEEEMEEADDQGSPQTMSGFM